MLEGLILEIELDVVIVGAVAHRDVKENLDSALGNRSQLVWLAEFNVVSKWNSDGTKVSEMRLGIENQLTGVHCHTQHRRKPS